MLFYIRVYQNHFNMKKILVLFVSALFLGCSVSSDQVYMFSYFRGNGEDGLHLAWSEDGYSFHAINDNESVLRPEAGIDKLMRDPCIIKGPDGLFHMVWTVSWNERGIGYASSPDLIEWSEQKYIPLMEHEPNARNCWAPEIFYDNTGSRFLIIWSTTISGLFPETEATADPGWDHRMYYTYTTDFEEFGPVNIFYDHGFNVIDGSILQHEDTYYLFLKDETRFPPEKNIRLATAAKAEGPYSPPGDPITGDYWAEGPSATFVDGYCVVYFDKYIEGTMGAVRSYDLKEWEDVSGNVNFPDGTNHGSVFKVDRAELERLLDYHGD